MMGFDTSVLDQAMAARRAAWEQERQTLLARLLALLDHLAGQFDVRQAYIFGSLAQPGSFRQDSDVDVDRMALEIEGIRPALLPADMTVHLHKLRSFRRFFRHAYGAPLEFERVAQNLHEAQQLRPLFWRVVNALLQALRGSGAEEGSEASAS